MPNRADVVALAAAILLLPAQAFASEIGYGIAHQTHADPVPTVDSGLEFRALFGGERGQKWSIWFGFQPERLTREGVAYGVPLDKMPGYSYVAGLRRFNLHLDGPVTLFAGTGLGYRGLTTCLPDGITCFSGDPFVSSRWAFTQELGFKWKAVELSLGHFSTGGISHLNHGVNLFRFTLFHHFGGKQ